MSDNIVRDDTLLRKILDAIPSFIFLVDEDMRIIEYNAAAGAILAEGREGVLRHRGGEVLHCLHSTDTPEGCGRSEYCRNCIIRNSVNDAMRGQATVRRRTRLEINYAGQIHEFYALVSATPLQHDGADLVLLVIEDMNQLTELQRLVPICARCGKVRDDNQYWERVEAYLKKHLDMDFTHSYCPTCLQKELAQIEDWTRGRREQL